MQTLIVIPARYASTRLPGKPLLRSTGKYLVQHVYEQAIQAKNVECVVATDDSRIVAAVESFGGRVVLTRRDHPSGTDRVAEVAHALGAELFVISVKEPFPYSAISEMQPVPPQEFFDAQERIARERVDAVIALANEAGVACQAHTIEALHPWEAILDHAKAQNCDLVVMASHGRRGLSALLLGSETQKVLTHSAIAVLIVK